MPPSKKPEYLIIIGANKAGTTSLFRYLSDHPDVCPAFIKQTFFFLDKEWQELLGLKPIYDHENGFEEFNKYFQTGNSNCIKLEASPEYLFAPGVPDRLRDLLNHRTGKLIMLLRDPVDRLKSLYFYGRQQGQIDVEESFEEFLDKNVDTGVVSYPSYMGRATGKYSTYLKRYMDLFGSSELKVIYFEDLVAHPETVLIDLCGELELDPAFFESYDFDVTNKTKGIRNAKVAVAYNKLRSVVVNALYKSDVGRRAGGQLKKVVAPLYRKLNQSTALASEVVISEGLEEMLRKEYTEDIKLVEDYLGMKSPWKQC